MTNRMPRTAGSDRGSSWAGMGQGYTMLVELLTAIGVWAAIGYGLDRLLGTGPVLFAIGMVVGAGTGIYILYRRALEASARETRGRSRSHHRGV